MKSLKSPLIIVISLVSTLSLAAPETNFFDDEIFESANYSQCIDNSGYGDLSMKDCTYEAVDDVLTQIKKEIVQSKNPKYTAKWLDKEYEKLSNKCQKEHFDEEGGGTLARLTVANCVLEKTYDLGRSIMLENNPSLLKQKKPELFPDNAYVYISQDKKCLNKHNGDYMKMASCIDNAADKVRDNIVRKMKRLNKARYTDKWLIDQHAVINDQCNKQMSEFRSDDLDKRDLSLAKCQLEKYYQLGRGMK